MGRFPRCLMYYSISWLYIFLTMTHIQTTRANVSVALDDLFNNVRNTVLPYKVNVILPSLNHLSPLAKEIVRRANLEFASNNYDFGGMSQILNTNWTEDQFEDYGNKRMLERVSLTMGLVELKNKSRAFLEMWTVLKYFYTVSPFTKGKYLLHVITEKELRLHHFLRKAWSKKFLDLTVVEWIERERGDEAEITLEQSEYRTVFVHSFNPFNNVFSKTILCPLTEIFPEKTKNLHGFILTTAGAEDNVTRNLLEPLNCTIRNLNSWPVPDLHPSFELFHFDIDLIEPWVYTGVDTSFDQAWEVVPYGHLKQAYIPVFHRFHFYLLRRSECEVTISWAAILTFAGLFYTALMFTIWARLLGFREPNWSFINILTAQMGGSIETRGRTKLSKQIFQMSIYIATFIVVTLGADYMYQIFVMSRKPYEIRTLQDLAESRMELFMDEGNFEYFDYVLHGAIGIDSRLKKIFNRTQPRSMIDSREESCLTRLINIPIEDGSINLCIIRSAEEDYLTVTPYGKSQVHNIQEPIMTSLQYIELGEHPFFKSRLEELICRFSEVGLLKKWLKDSNLRKSPKFGPDSAHVEKKGEDEVPLQEQLWPILWVGFASGIIALIGEIIWKCLIEKTELGKLVRAYYNSSRPSSSDRAAQTSKPRNHLTVLTNYKKIKVEEWDHIHYPNVDSTGENLALAGNKDRRMIIVAEVHRHEPMLQNDPAKNTTNLIMESRGITNFVKVSAHLVPIHEESDRRMYYVP